MRAHVAAGPAVHRAAITVIVPRGHPLHRAATHRAAGSPRRTVRWQGMADGAVPTPAVTALVCAVALVLAALLVGSQRAPSSAAVSVPWQSATPRSMAVTAGTAPVLPAPAPPAVSVLTVPLPAPHFVHLPYRLR
jgi:hypothetical protein